jgi:hypothetical protein
MPSNGILTYFPFVPIVLIWGFVVWAFYVTASSLARISRSAQEATNILRQIVDQQNASTQLPQGPQ